MGLVQYHNDFYIKEVLRAQIRRVAAAWEHLERNVVNDVEWTDSNGNVHKHQYRDVQKEWIDWMTAIHRERLEKLNQALKDKISVFSQRSGVRRWDYFGVFRRANDGVPNCGFEKDNNVMKKRIGLLLDAKAGLVDVNTELTLDIP
jgi:hypothetical protein